VFNGRRRMLCIGLASVAMAGTSWAPRGRAQPGGKLEVHALDATIGKPAEGVLIDLFDVSAEPALRIRQVATNANGQADLIDAGPLKVGRYELRFAFADYFRKRGLVLGDPPFLDVVPIRIYVGNAHGRYHVPIVFTPWSYTMHG
jgi:2-oxo-4-hydroxy-4-carboxy-5-ureidoimidazoline decarboxylase